MPAEILRLSFIPASPASSSTVSNLVAILQLIRCQLVVWSRMPTDDQFSSIKHKVDLIIKALEKLDKYRFRDISKSPSPPDAHAAGKEFREILKQLKEE